MVVEQKYFDTDGNGEKVTGQLYLESEQKKTAAQAK
jgi:hypothetical protein